MSKLNFQKIKFSYFSQKLLKNVLFFVRVLNLTRTSISHENTVDYDFDFRRKPQLRCRI